MNDGQLPVLIVDDDEILRRLFTRILEQEGIPCRTATNGEEALVSIRTAPVALMLIDDRMPGMTGPELIQQLRQSPDTRALPIILVSGSGPGNQGTILDCGTDDYLMKPVTNDDLVAHVKALLPNR